MIRESVQLWICLSVLVSTTVSLHMIRDAYHRPLNELSNRDTLVIDSTNTKRIPSVAELSMRTARDPQSNKYHELFPSSLSYSSSSSVAASGSSSSSSPSSALPLSMSFRGGSLARSTVTDSDGRYRWQKQVLSLNNLTNNQFYCSIIAFYGLQHPNDFKCDANIKQ